MGTPSFFTSSTTSCSTQIMGLYFVGKYVGNVARWTKGILIPYHLKLSINFVSMLSNTSNEGLFWSRIYPMCSSLNTTKTLMTYLKSSFNGRSPMADVCFR